MSANMHYAHRRDPPLLGYPVSPAGLCIYISIKAEYARTVGKNRLTAAKKNEYTWNIYLYYVYKLVLSTKNTHNRLLIIDMKQLQNAHAHPQHSIFGTTHDTTYIYILHVQLKASMCAPYVHLRWALVSTFPTTIIIVCTHCIFWGRWGVNACILGNANSVWCVCVCGA